MYQGSQCIILGINAQEIIFKVNNIHISPAACQHIQHIILQPGKIQGNKAINHRER